MEHALCADIGGTHANFCIAQFKDSILITDKKTFSTKDASNFSELINQYLDQQKCLPKIACFAVAGPVDNQRVEMTNVDVVIDAEEITQKTNLEKVLIINDFDSVGYATNVLETSEIKVINQGKSIKNATRAAIGAGTGLGKSILIYDAKSQSYIPHASEGGHTDFPMFFPEETTLLQNFGHPTYEDFLSGRGLESLYRALQQTTYTNEQRALTARDISKKRHHSPCCIKTFEWFVKFYARCAKNFAIDLLSRGGLFIAGGIAAANQDMFGISFMDEFTKHRLPKYRRILQEMPVLLIKNYEVSLKGAAFALKIHLGQ